MPKTKDQLREGLKQRYRDASTIKVNVFDAPSLRHLAESIQALSHNVLEVAPTDISAEAFIDEVEAAYKKLLLAVGSV